MSEGKRGAEENIARLMRSTGPRRPLPEDVRERLEESFRTALAGVYGRRGRVRLGIAAIGAAVVLTVGLWSFTEREAVVEAGVVSDGTGEVYWQRGEAIRPPMAGARLRRGDILRTEDGRLRVAVAGLTAGLRMDNETRVTITGRRQFRLERGAIYVDARDDVDYPIVIETDRARVEHLGTQFLVADRANRLVVAVREGSVRIKTGEATFTGSATEHEGEMLEFGEGVLRAPITGYDEMWRWVNEISPHFDTHNRPVSEFLEWVARETGRELRYADDETKAHAATTRTKGSIDTTNADKALFVVLSTTTLRAKQPLDGVILIEEG